MSAVRIEPIAGGSVTSAPGFEAAGVSCGLKPDGALDLALIYASRPCVAAAMFTTNIFKAAAVLYDQELVRENPDGLRAVVINSGCANACTGEQGLDDARDMAAKTAQLLGIEPQGVFVMSTGVIGARLPMDKIRRGLELAVGQLSADPDSGHRASRAIMTTDTVPKTLAVRVCCEAGEFTIAAMVKGSGMIHPNMATMLGTMVTDVKITPDLAGRALREAVEVSFNLVTVDGDTSTNDTAVLFANGGSEVDITSQASASYRAFVEGLTYVAVELAKALARDGEGATKFVEIHVEGASCFQEAKQVAQSVAGSLLVKTAIYGQDANWGRIVCAVGYSGASLDPDKVSVWLGDLELFRRGAPYNVDEGRAAQILARDEILIRIDLGQGRAEATVWTCDLSHGYVDINAHYRT